MRNPNNIHRAIRSLHKRIDRIQQYIDKYIPGRTVLLPQFVELVHLDINRRNLSLSQVEDVRHNLDRCYYNIVKSFKSFELDNPENITPDLDLQVATKYELWILIRNKVKGHKIKRGEFKSTMKKFAKEK